MKYSILQSKLASMQICTNVAPENRQEMTELLTLVNRENPTGIDSKWNLSTDPKLAPVACEGGPNHWHYILTC